MKLKAIITVGLIVFASEALCKIGETEDYLVDCTGINLETSSDVAGKCTEAHFDGIDLVTGKKVYGDCAPGGDLDGYDSETGVAVSGECEEK